MGHLSKEELERMKSVDLLKVEINDLVDIKDIHIDGELPEKERIMDFIKQIKNPYCFKCNNVVIKVTFSDSKETMEDRLEKYLDSL